MKSIYDPVQNVKRNGTKKIIFWNICNLSLAQQKTVVFPVNLPMKSDHPNRTQERIMYITQRLAHIYTTSVDFSKEISNEKLCLWADYRLIYTKKYMISYVVQIFLSSFFVLVQSLLRCPNTQENIVFFPNTTFYFISLLPKIYNWFDIHRKFELLYNISHMLHKASTSINKYIFS
jgi:hypothetical protein